METKDVTVDNHNYPIIILEYSTYNYKAFILGLERNITAKQPV